MFSSIDLVLAMGFAWMISGIMLIILNRRSISNPALPGSLLILVSGLTFIDNFIKPGMMSESLTRVVFSISRNSYFLFGPFLLFYTQAVLFHKKDPKRILVHLIPFFVMALHSFFNPSSLLPVPLSQKMFLPSDSYIRPGLLRDVLSLLSRSGYCFSVFILLKQRKTIVPDFYSRKTIRNTLSWLFYLSVFYLFLYTFTLIVSLLPPGGYFPQTLAASIVRLVPSLVFIFLFSSFAQNQAVPEDRKITKTVSDEKYRNSGISQEESKRIFQHLSSYISEKELYLDPDLNLETLAQQMGETRHRLSEVINRESGENFYAYINGFRLREFITAVEENTYPDYTILAIALECGFKSQSAFYKLFKMKMGITPREFLKTAA